MAAVSMVQGRGAAQPPVDEVSVRRLLSALEDMRDGKFRRRLPETGDGVLLELARTYNEVAERNARLAAELRRVRRTAGRDGRLTERLDGADAPGTWADCYEDANALVDDLVRPVTEVARVDRGGGRGRPVAAHRAAQRQPAAARGVPADRAHRQRDGRPARAVHRRGHPGRPRGRHRGQPRRPGQGARGVGQLEGPHRLGELDGQQPHQPGPRHRPGHHRGGQRRPLPQDHGRREGRAVRAEEHDQHDGRPAVVVRLRGDPGGPRGRHRGQARRPGRGARRLGHLEGPHRQRQRHGQQPHRPGPLDRPGVDRGRPRRPEPEDHRRGQGRGRRPSPTPSTRWSTRCAPSPTR